VNRIAILKHGNQIMTKGTGTPSSAVTERLSNSLRERCKVLSHFDQQCKNNKMGISLRHWRGLRTVGPNKPINFWWYEPQSDKDKAPKKKKPHPQKSNKVHTLADIALAEATVQIKGE
jgi:hypothetical protein